MFCLLWTKLSLSRASACGYDKHEGPVCLACCTATLLCVHSVCKSSIHLRFVSQVKHKLSEDELERLIDALEKLHHAEIQQHPERWANLIGSPLQAK